MQRLLCGWSGMLQFANRCIYKILELTASNEIWRSAMLKVFLAAIIGSVSGSAILGLFFSFYTALHPTAYDPVFTCAAALFVTFFLGSIYSFIPVLIFTAILGPVILRLSFRSGGIDKRIYYGITTALFCLPGMLITSSAFIFAVGLLLTYGYPTAYAYIKCQEKYLATSRQVEC